MVEDAFDGYPAVIRIYSPINGVYLLDVNGTLMNVSVFNGIGKAECCFLSDFIMQMQVLTIRITIQL